MAYWPLDPASSVLIVSHDAGAANILWHLLDHLPDTLTILAEGPALEILKRHSRLAEVPRTTRGAGFAVDLVITGTSESNDLEVVTIGNARAAGVPSVAVLDHWTNFGSRFSRGGQERLPDEIWVVDEYAHQLAEDSFPATPVVKIPNFYILDTVNQVQQLRSATTAGRSKAEPSRTRILYASEPAGPYARNLCENPAFVGYSEFDAVSYFLNHVDDFFPNLSSITLRTHPSEPRDKYASTLQAFHSISVSLSTSELAADLAAHDVVVGTHSNVLAIALQAGMPAFSAIPPSGPPCLLPHEGITHL